MERKVKFKKEISDRIINEQPSNKSYSNMIHIDSIDGSYQSYNKSFLEEPYMIVSQNNGLSGNDWKIEWPRNIANFHVKGDHIIDYNHIEITIDDSEWEW